MASISDAQRKQLLNSLQGHTLIIPDLQALTSHWPHEINPEIERLRQDVDRRLEELFQPGERLRIMKETNIALFGASWWPYASFEALRIATYLSLWLFVWDDETDSAEFSSLVSDVDRGEAFRAATINYIKRSLSRGTDELKSRISPSDIVTSFQPIADAISRSSTAAQIDLFLRELVFFVNMTGVEQRCQMRDELPTVEEYQERRMGSSAVGVCLAITEYCFGMAIPPSVMREGDMKQLWDATNVIISTTNDILSIRKEIAQEQVDTLIPLLYRRHGTLAAAVEQALDTVQVSVKSLEEAAMQLRSRYSHNSELRIQLEKFIIGCQCACTANLSWSLGSGRYKLGRQSLRGGIQVRI